MKTQTPRLTLWLALAITATLVFAQDTEPAPLPDEWGRIEKAVDLSLDQIQTLRTILDARKAALSDWEKTNAPAIDALRQEFKAGPESLTPETRAALEARMKPLAADRDTIKNRFDAQMKDVLRPEQKAAWEVFNQYGKNLRPMLETPGLTDDQKSKLTTAFKDFALSLGRLDAANHSDAPTVPAALKADREKLVDDGAAALFAILTPDQRTTVKTKLLQQDLENKLRKVKATPEQLAAAQALCEAEAKAMTGISSKDFIQARNNLQQAILANVLTAEQKNPAPNAPQPAKPAPATP